MTLLASLRSVRYICKLFNQPWEGDITMVLPATYNELRRAIVNPNRKELAEVAHQGQLEAFAKLSAVQSNCAIEMTLDECMALVTSELMRRDKAEVRHACVGVVSCVCTAQLSLLLSHVTLRRRSSVVTEPTPASPRGSTSSPLASPLCPLQSHCRGLPTGTVPT